MAFNGPIRLHAGGPPSGLTWRQDLGTPPFVPGGAYGSQAETWRGASGETTRPSSTVPGLAPPPAPPVFEGGHAGPYRLLERLGRGRQAEVWRAVLPGGDASEVALKVLPVDAADAPGRFAQLRHEAERGQRLADPALLPTYDFGAARGLAYFAMPMVEGCTLADLIDRRRGRPDGPPAGGTDGDGLLALADAPTPVYDREVVRLLARVARGLAAAHAGRVAHRDVKPANILVRRPADTPWGRRSRRGRGVFLCDFGLARDLDVATPGQLRDGAGSPLYMAPERLLRRPADEFRSDVYALGVTLFEALALRPPVETPDGLSGSLWAGYLAGQRPRRLAEVRPDLPERLRSAVDRALSRDPARRHPGALAFAQDLERVDVRTLIA